MSAEVAQLSVKISADTKNAEEGLNRTSEKVKETGGGFKEALGHIAEFTGAGLLVDGVTSAVGFLKDNLTEMVSSGMDANRMDAVLAQGLKSTHDASGQTAQSLDDLSTKLMNMTGIDDDTVKSAESMLLTFTNIGKGVFPQATQAVADLAARMANGAIPNADQMRTASIELGKALQDPITGVTALKKVGIDLSDAEKEQIKTMMAHGDIAGAQKVILGELNTEFGGTAAAAGQANGGIAILGAQFDNFKQTIGQAIIPILTALMNVLTPMTGALMNALPGAIKTVQGVFQQWQPVLQYAWNTLQQLGQIITIALKPAFDTLSKAFDDVGKSGLSQSGVMNTINQVFNAAVGIINQLAPVLNKLAQWFVSTGLPAVQQFGQWFQNSLLPILEQVGTFFISTMLPALGNFANWIVTIVLPAVEQLVTWFGEKVMPVLEEVWKVIWTNVMPALESIGTTILQKLVPALEGLWNQLSPILIPALQFLGGVLQNVVGPAINIVINIISGLINALTGIIGAVGWVLGKIGDFVGGVLGFFGNLFDQLVGHSIIPDLINGIISWFGQLPGKVLGFIGTLVGNLLGALGNLRDSAVNKASDLVSGFMNALGGLPGKLLTFGGNLIQNLINGIQNMAGNLATAAKNAIGGALNNIPGVGGLLSHIPGFAGGGTMPYNGMAIVGESGPELVKLPAGAQVYSASESARMFAPAASAGGAAMAGANGGVYIAPGTSLTIPVQVNGRVMAHALLPDLVSAIQHGTGIRHMTS